VVVEVSAAAAVVVVVVAAVAAAAVEAERRLSRRREREREREPLGAQWTPLCSRGCTRGCCGVPSELPREVEALRADGARRDGRGLC